jgi:glycosyltransferase involved in cell wall biosynthesis
MILPVSAVVPTCNRAHVLRQAFDTLAAQQVLPAEIIVVDASTDPESRLVVEEWGLRVAPGCNVIWRPASETGAAIQRNQGIAISTQPFIWFFDDDVVFEAECLMRLWDALQSDSRLGGVNAMIVNQRYQPPGLISRLMFGLMNGGSEETFAGRVIGPAVNLLPEDREDLPVVVPVEWLNTTCTLYRREALPNPPFASQFVGYSAMEDVALSLVVGRAWKLANARTARIYHNSQPGAHKASVVELTRMRLVNRHYVMTEVLNRRGVAAYTRFALWELFGLLSGAASKEGLKTLPQSLFGRLAGAATVMRKCLDGPGEVGS